MADAAAVLLDAAGFHVVIVALDGTAVLITDEAARLLAPHGPLADLVERWPSGPATPASERIVGTGRDQLCLRILPFVTSNAHAVRVQRRATTTEMAALTVRQLEILALVADGARNADIAEILSISVRTVKKHVELVLAGLGVQSRTEAAALFIRATSGGEGLLGGST